MQISNDNPNIALLFKTSESERAFSGTAPSQTGSYKAAEETQIVNTFIVDIQKEVWLQEHWIRVAEEEKEEKLEIQLKKPVSVVREEKKKAIEESVRVPEEKEEKEEEYTLLKKRLLEKLVKIQEIFDKDMKTYQVRFSESVVKYGYTDNTATKFSDSLIQIALNKKLSQEDRFIRYRHQTGAHVADQYKRQADQTSLSTMLAIKSLVIAHKMEEILLNRLEAGDITFLAAQKKLTDDARLARDKREQDEALIAEEAKKHLPEKEYQAFMQSIPEPSAPPVPTPVATFIPGAIEVNNAGDCPVAEVNLIETDQMLNLADLYIDQFACAPTPQFTQCAKFYIEEEVVPAIDDYSQSIDQAFTEVAAEFTPSVLEKLEAQAFPSAPPAQEDDILDPSAPPEVNNEEDTTWKAPVPRPPVWRKPNDD